MATTVVDPSVVTDAVITALGTWGTPKGIEIGDHDIPAPASADDVPGKTRPVIVVLRVPSGRRGSNLGWDGEEAGMMKIRHQIMGVAMKRQQADRAANEAIGALLERSGSGYALSVSLSGMSILNREYAGEAAPDQIGSFWCGGFVDLWVQVV